MVLQEIATTYKYSIYKQQPTVTSHVGNILSIDIKSTPHIIKVCSSYISHFTLFLEGVLIKINE